LEKIADTLYKRISSSKSYGKTITIKVKFSDFQQITRSKTVDYEIKYRNEIIDLVEIIMNAEDFASSPIRLLGISISNFKKDKPEKEVSMQLTFDF
jgi:DNA polymerase-4